MDSAGLLALFSTNKREYDPKTALSGSKCQDRQISSYRSYLSGQETLFTREL